MKKKKGEKVDNSCAALKAQLRRAYLPPDARVLDLFAGHGEMYRRAYAGNVSNYYGVDKQVVHDAALCTLGDNIKFVCQNDITKYNVFDLDAYGIPWDLFFLIIKRLKKGEYIFFLTDGLPVQLDKSRGYLLSKIIRATERFARRFTVRGMSRFYFDIIRTLLWNAETRYGIKIELAKYTHNKTYMYGIPTVYYWVLKVKKLC